MLWRRRRLVPYRIRAVSNACRGVSSTVQYLTITRLISYHCTAHALCPCIRTRIRVSMRDYVSPTLLTVHIRTLSSPFATQIYAIKLSIWRNSQSLSTWRGLSASHLIDQRLTGIRRIQTRRPALTIRIKLVFFTLLYFSAVRLHRAYYLFFFLSKRNRFSISLAAYRTRDRPCYYTTWIQN